MNHVVLSVLCFVLWAFALNLICGGLILASGRVRGSALAFTVGLACLISLLAICVQAHIDIALSFRYAGLTSPLVIPLLVRRIRRAGRSLP